MAYNILYISICKTVRLDTLVPGMVYSTQTDCSMGRGDFLAKGYGYDRDTAF